MKIFGCGIVSDSILAIPGSASGSVLLQGHPILTGDYSTAARWERLPITVGTSIAKPTPVFATFDQAVVDENRSASRPGSDGHALSAGQEGRPGGSQGPEGLGDRRRRRAMRHHDEAALGPRADIAEVPTSTPTECSASSINRRVAVPVWWSTCTAVALSSATCVHDAAARRPANRWDGGPRRRLPAPARAPVPCGAGRGGQVAAPGGPEGPASGSRPRSSRRQCWRRPRPGRGAAQPGGRAGLVLIYPFLDPTASFDSYTTASDGFDPREAAWYWKQYAASPTTSPTRTSRRCGPTWPARAVPRPAAHARGHRRPGSAARRGGALAALLAEAGVEVTATRYLGQVHGFWRHPDVFDAAEPLARQVAGYVETLAASK